jgi:hypothetical protein
MGEAFRAMLPYGVRSRGQTCSSGGKRVNEPDSDYVVELAGIEPATPCLQSRCATELRDLTLIEAHPRSWW